MINHNNSWLIISHHFLSFFFEKNLVVSEIVNTFAVYYYTSTLIHYLFMLTINNLSFTYPRAIKPVIDGISLSLEPGSVYALLGPNGAGKSTLLYLIAGLLTPYKGEVLLNGTNTRLRLPETLKDIYLVPEEFTLPSITMAEYCSLYSKFYPNFSYQVLQANLLTFDLPMDMHLASLSMGQKKKAMMCFALATNTPLLLMDEPTNGLDIPGKVSFRSFIASQMSDNRTIIISTHQVQDVARLLDHVIIMNENRILLNSSSLNITKRLIFTNTTNPETIASALLAKPSIAGTAVVLENEDGSESELNIELLFELVTSNPSLINKLFQPTPPPYENH